jgi:hypothetical protein
MCQEQRNIMDLGKQALNMRTPKNNSTYEQCNCRNPSFGLATKARGCKVVSQKEGNLGAKAKALEGCGPRGSPGVTTHSREFKEVQGSVREWTLTLPRQLPFWERESRWTPEISKGKLKGQVSMDCCARVCPFVHLSIRLFVQYPIG